MAELQFFTSPSKIAYSPPLLPLLEELHWSQIVIYILNVCLLFNATPPTLLHTFHESWDGPVQWLLTQCWAGRRAWEALAKSWLNDWWNEWGRQLLLGLQGLICLQWKHGIWFWTSYKQTSDWNMSCCPVGLFLHPGWLHHAQHCVRCPHRVRTGTVPSLPAHRLS